jgi:hypothetical protein
MSWMLLVALALLCWASLPGKAEVLTLSCDGTMKEEEQQKPHAINKMRLIVNFDVRTVTGFTGIIASFDEVDANSVLCLFSHSSGAAAAPACDRQAQSTSVL